MSRRRRTHESGGHERWLVSYADFITLLFAFFVVMYALAMQDKAKLKAVADSIRAAFEGRSNITVIQTDARPSASRELAPDAAASPPSSASPATPPGAAHDAVPAPSSAGDGALPEDMKKILESLKEVLPPAAGPADPFASPFEVTQVDHDIVVRLWAKSFFLSGRAEVREEALPLLDRIVEAVGAGLGGQVKRTIHVEGHTDTQPLQSEDFPSNWELSAARATWVVRYFLRSHQEPVPGGSVPADKEALVFDPARLMAAGYAEFRPLADNKTEQGRARNRRVEIVIRAGGRPD